jgi:mono/diheme cytochrome c family protein
MTDRMIRFVCLSLASLVAISASSWPARAGENAGLIARGHEIAMINCSRCHAVGRTGLSPNPKSPPFRFLSRKYPLSGLEEALAEGIMVGHEGLEMPHFQLSPAQIDAFLAYLTSIQEK